MDIVLLYESDMKTNIPKTVHFGKIVATVGPASESEEGITALVEAGVDVFRLNFSHGSHEEQGQRITYIREQEEKRNRPIGIVADLQGPKLRIGTFADDEGVVVASGAPFTFHLKERVGDVQGVSLMHPEIFQSAEVGMDVLVDDGRLQFQVTAVSAESLETTVIIGGRVKQKKGVNIPGVQLPVAALTEKDKKDMAFALSRGVDWVALSFVQRPEDVLQAREMIGDAAGIIAKIEKPSAVERIEEIIAVVDGIMVARGDLGVEIPPEEVPSAQKKIINLCRQAGKPVIVATHMLDSMVDAPRPTRAEVSDVANAIYDGADAVMLSAETAAGDHPTESVEMMRKIVRRSVADSAFFTAEKEINLTALRCDTDPSIADAQKIVAAQKKMQSEKPTAIAVTATSVDHVMCYARERYRHPLLAITRDQRLARHLTLLWGVSPVYMPDAIPEGEEGALSAIKRYLGMSDTAIEIAMIG